MVVSSIVIVFGAVLDPSIVEFMSTVFRTWAITGIGRDRVGGPCALVARRGLGKRLKVKKLVKSVRLNFVSIID